MMSHSLLAAALTGLAAQPGVARQGVERMPTPAEIVFVYPRAEYRAHMPGIVSLDCATAPSGSPRRCDVVSQSPEGRGFDKAASKLVAYMKFSKASADYSVRFDIGFDPPQAEKWPDYLRIPAAEDIQRVWPAGTKGEFDVACALGTDAIPHDCEIVEPVNASEDLQNAAVESMRLFRFSPGLRGGEPAAAFVIVPFRFSGR